MLRLLIVAAASIVPAVAEVIDDGYDCRLRALALEYARDVVLRPWSTLRAQHAEALVTQGLALSECSQSKILPAMVGSASLSPGNPPADASNNLFLSPKGDDSAAGSRTAPLGSLTGAQARIRSLWPDPDIRPAITVSLLAGTYLNAGVAFGRQDSGASPSAGITYAAALGADGVPEAVTLSGGVDLNALGLSWQAAGPAGVFRTRLPAADTPQFSSEEQMFLAGWPLVRARVPNGRPWIPLDGFNLTAGKNFTVTHTVMPDIPSALGSCSPTQWPAAPSVPRGECGEMEDDVSLISGLDSCHRAGTTDDAAACAAICAGDERCNFWTWHDDKQTGYEHDCYVRYDWTYHLEQHFPGHVSGVCNHTLPSNGRTSNFPCQAAKAVCASTKETVWPSGSNNALLGVPSAKELGGTFTVEDCSEKARTSKDFPMEWKAGSYGYIESDSESKQWINKLDDSHNLPFWQGPWAGGFAVDTSQDAGNFNWSAMSWNSPSDIVVHAMADGEWGGCQFRVADVPVELSGSNAILKFQYGGWQQARTAMLYGDPNEQNIGNRFYMEGSLEFLDDEGEWHFDSSSGMLYVFPPADLQLTAASMADAELILTQRDRMLEFIGEDGAFVQNVAFANLTLAHTSAQFFKPHEETSGGDYAVHRGGAVFVENAGNLTFVGNVFEHIGGNAIFLSNAVRDVRVSANLFRFLGTSGVSLVGRTGEALGDGRDGEAMAARYGAEHDNGVRLPQRNVIEHNVFTDWGIWDKQSACFHRALAPHNVFLNNVCFNSSRHAVNFQDSMGGGGKVEGNLVFNLNRESRDTSAFNSWGRRTYVLSDESDPAKPRIVPETPHSWHRNMILVRNYHAGGYQDNGDALRCDDGATWYNISSNVMYRSGVEFNGGGEIWTHGNLFVHSGWTLCHYLTIGGSSHDTFIDSEAAWRSICGAPQCETFWVEPSDGEVKLATYRGDHNIAVLNSTGRAESLDWSQYWCGVDLETWQARTGQDRATELVNGGKDYSPDAVVAQARRMLWGASQPTLDADAPVQYI